MMDRERSELRRLRALWSLQAIDGCAAISRRCSATIRSTSRRGRSSSCSKRSIDRPALGELDVSEESTSPVVRLYSPPGSSACWSRIAVVAERLLAHGEDADDLAIEDALVRRRTLVGADLDRALALIRGAGRAAGLARRAAADPVTRDAVARAFAKPEFASRGSSCSTRPRRDRLGTRPPGVARLECGASDRRRRSFARRAGQEDRAPARRRERAAARPEGPRRRLGRHEGPPRGARHARRGEGRGGAAGDPRAPLRARAPRRRAARARGVRRSEARGSDPRAIPGPSGRRAPRRARHARVTAGVGGAAARRRRRRVDPALGTRAFVAEDGEPRRRGARRAWAKVGRVRASPAEKEARIRSCERSSRSPGRALRIARAAGRSSPGRASSATRSSARAGRSGRT